jgi:hypothetical protein
MPEFVTNWARSRLHKQHRLFPIRKMHTLFAFYNWFVNKNTNETKTSQNSEMKVHTFLHSPMSFLVSFSLEINFSQIEENVFLITIHSLWKNLSFFIVLFHILLLSSYAQKVPSICRALISVFWIFIGTTGTNYYTTSEQLAERPCVIHHYGLDRSESKTWALSFLCKFSSEQRP